MNYTLINKESKLVEIIPEIENESDLAVDIEADSMYHFKEKVCLIQIAKKNGMVFIIDPLEIKDLSLLKKILEKENIKKIFHSSYYDIQCLFRDFDIRIKNLFDTQIACRFLGIKKTGLESVIKQFFNIKLDKKYQKKDWSQRPLPEKMIEYAAKDVYYLIQLTQILEESLLGKGYLSWFYEECEIASNLKQVINNDEPLYLKFKGANHLSPKSLAICEILLKFRKNIAEKRDKPLFKILEDKVIMRLSIAKPLNMKHLIKLDVLSKLQINKYGEDLIKLIKEANDIDNKHLPLFPSVINFALPSYASTRIKKIKEWRDNKARELNIEPTLVLNKASINEIAIIKNIDHIGMKNLEEMRSWQKEKLGFEILKILSA